MWYAFLNETLDAGVVEPPEPQKKVDPKYLTLAVKDHVEGRVELACFIRENGTVDGIRVIKSLDDRLDVSASHALGKWTFKPAIRNGIPMDVEVYVSIPFKLDPEMPR